MGDWIWLSDFDSTKDLFDGNGYGNTVAEVLASKEAFLAGTGYTVIYPGDADLIDLSDGNNQNDFSGYPLYDVSSNSYHKLDISRSSATATSSSSYRDYYFTINSSTGLPDITTAPNISSDPDDGNLRYTKDGNYIVFRNINMALGYQVTLTDGNGNWKPLMFNGTMYGITSTGSEKVTDLASYISDPESSAGRAIASRKPIISNINVVPTLYNGKLDLKVQTGVGFFGTITGKYNDSSLISTQVKVCNIKLYNGTVDNDDAQRAAVEDSILNGVLTLLAEVLGLTLQGLINLLTGNFGQTQLTNTLKALLNARAADPGSLATGAFAGRIVGDAVVLDCEAEQMAVNTRLTAYEDGTVKENILDSDGNIIGEKAKKMIVGKGGFAGLSQGEAQYEGLSGLLGGLTAVLSGILNIIPGIGLSDLITILLGNVLDVSKLIPTGYISPMIEHCKVINGTLSDEDGKYGVGGFIGSQVGTEISDCHVVVCGSADDPYAINAEMFGGGFCGIERDAIIRTTLSGLKIELIPALNPQSELINCSITGSSVSVTGNSYLGGFCGAMANSYAFDGTIDATSSVSVEATGDYAGGFAGRAMLGTGITMGEYIPNEADLLSTVTGLLTSILTEDADQSLLEVAGVSPSAIMGCQIMCPLTVSAGGNYAGGIVGQGEGVRITRPDTDNLRGNSNDDHMGLAKYRRKIVSGEHAGEYYSALPDVVEQDNILSDLISVEAEGSYAGGIAGYLTTGSVAGLLDGTVAGGSFVRFYLYNTNVAGPADPGYTVSAGENYAGGGIGWGTGGRVKDVELTNLASVTAADRAGGFVGATGPGSTLSGSGVDLSLLGITLISVSDLFTVADALRTTYTRANVTGIDSGFEVAVSGQGAYAGGYAGEASSMQADGCHANKLKSVTTASTQNLSRAGGFVGQSVAGGVLGAVDSGSVGSLSADKKLLALNGLLDGIPDLIPYYDGCDVIYVDGGFIQGDYAGGFAGDFQSGQVNTRTLDENDNSVVEYESGHYYTVGIPNGESALSRAFAVKNIHHVRGGTYAGGFGGRVYSGALASSNGLSLFEGFNTLEIGLNDLLDVVKAYVPRIRYAGVSSVLDTTAEGERMKGYSVYAARNNPAEESYAGGFIGYGSGVQVSYSDVNRLKNGEPDPPSSLTHGDAEAYGRIGLEPDALESQDGSSYMSFDNSPDSMPYAVAGGYYAGGYFGKMDISSAAAVGGGINALGKTISLTNAVEALNVVISTAEHSHVYGAPGGFSVIGSSMIYQHNGSFDQYGVAHSGGFAGSISGGHVQDCNVNNFYYIIGEITAGGYVGEMYPGSVANVLDNTSVGLLASVDNLASLVNDFVPTIRNSYTNCVPCGGAVRAEKESGTGVQRGMAGGYVGHAVGAQIWGRCSEPWKESNPYGEDPDIEPMRDCAAIRIRSVYGAEYAGGFCGLMECGSTASAGGGLSLLNGILSVNNLLSAADAVYTTIKYSAVYGPLRMLDEATWNAWKQYVGQYGVFYAELARASYDEQAGV